MRLSPLAVVVSPSKPRITHDLTSCRFNMHVASTLARISRSPPFGIGSCVAKYYLAHLVFRRPFGSHIRIVMSKIDVTETFRQVDVQWAGEPVFGYDFREWVLADRGL